MIYLVLPPTKAVRRLIQLGLPIELSYDNFVVFGGKSVEDRYIEEMTRNSQDLGGSIKVMHAPYDDLDPSIALSDMVFGRFIKWFDFCHKLNVSMAVVHTVRINEKHEKALDMNIELLRTLAREAGDRGIKLAIENRLEKNLFGSKPRDLMNIINNLNEGIGICLDVGHANINKNLEEFLSIGRHIIAIHAHDNDGYKDLHKPPYSGTVRWNLIESWIAKAMFNGLIVFETMCKDSVSICDAVVNQIRSTPLANL